MYSLLFDLIFLWLIDLFVMLLYSFSFCIVLFCAQFDLVHYKKEVQLS